MHYCRKSTACFVSSSFKLFTLCLLTTYFVYIEIRARITDNWDSTRKIGFSQTGVCSSNGGIFGSIKYGVSLYSISFYESNGVVPICEKMVDKISGNSICFNNLVYLQCQSSLLSLSSDQSIESLTNKFSGSSRSYFPNSLFITIAGFLCIALTYLFEDNGRDFVLDNEGRFSSRVDKLIMVKVNAILTIGIVIVLFVSASTFILIHPENCSLSFHSNVPGDSNFCATLNSCGVGVEISSVISPDDFLVQNYKSFTSFFGIMLSISVMLMCNKDYQRDREHGRIIPGAEDFQRDLYPNIVANNVRLNIWRRDSSASENYYRNRQNELVREISTRQLLRSAMENMPSEWKIVTMTELQSITERVDCSICLGSLSPTIAISRPQFLGSRSSSYHCNSQTHLNLSGNRNGRSMEPEQSITIVDYNSDGDIQMGEVANRSGGADIEAAVTSVVDNSPINNNRPSLSSCSSFNSILNATTAIGAVHPLGSLSDDNDLLSYPRGTSTAVATSSDVVKLPCKHMFHISCMLEWYAAQPNRATCPMCRQNVLLNNDQNVSDNNSNNSTN